MKVVMVARSTLYSNPGGDTTQIDMTAKYLRILGVGVDIALSDEKIAYENYDLLHFFNIIRPDDILCHLKSGKPYVISTIFVEFTEFDKMARRGMAGLLLKVLSNWQAEYLKALARFIVKGDKIKSRYFLFHGQFNSVLHVAKNAKLLLPNSHSEYSRMQKKLKKSFPYKKVVNAIDTEVFNDDVVEDISYKNHILIVGRIEGGKNQLNVIKALGGTEYQLTMIGRAAVNQTAYYNECRKLASQFSNIHFVEEFIEHKKLVSIYKAAKVHVLASWFETTGLVSLEAAMMDCNVVITKKGDTGEYFKDMAFYCDPGDVDSIKEAIIKAYHAPANHQLKTFIKENYTWHNAAKQTLEAYNSVIANNKIITLNPDRNKNEEIEFGNRRYKRASK
jgi:glycosyltransferase involved in cell wall biosynthesis